MKRIPRFTTRRWLITTAGIALVLSAINWFQAYERVVSARQDYQRRLVWYREGRVLESEMAALSRQLMAAECSLSFTSHGRMGSIRAHIHRLESFRKELAREVTHELHGDRGSGPAELRELDASLEQARSLLAGPR